MKPIVIPGNRWNHLRNEQNICDISLELAVHEIYPGNLQVIRVSCNGRINFQRNSFQNVRGTFSNVHKRPLRLFGFAFKINKYARIMYFRCRKTLWTPRVIPSCRTRAG